MEAAVQRECGLSSEEGEGVSGVEACQGGEKQSVRKYTQVLTPDCQADAVRKH